jgi:hypothetical protein
MQKAKTECPNWERNNKECPCTYDCERHAVCCKCIAYHRRAGSPPACMKSK